MAQEAAFLSVVIPTYNEEPRLAESLEKVAAFLLSQPYAYEVLVVENGSTDHTLEIARSYAGKYPFMRVIEEKQKGKGRAVRAGMLAARGQYRFMCDADLSMPIEELPRFLPPLSSNAEIVIASREAEGAIRYNEPEHRHIGGRLINFAIKLLILPGLDDTQCGFKSFTAAAAEDLFSIQTLTGWSFDIELLFVARRRGYTIHELPIPWYYSPHSHVNPVKDALKMAFDILKVRLNALCGRYARLPHA